LFTLLAAAITAPYPQGIPGDSSQDKTTVVTFTTSNLRVLKDNTNFKGCYLTKDQIQATENLLKITPKWENGQCFTGMCVSDKLKFPICNAVTVIGDATAQIALQGSCLNCPSEKLTLEISKTKLQLQFTNSSTSEYRIVKQNLGSYINFCFEFNERTLTLKAQSLEHAKSASLEVSNLEYPPPTFSFICLPGKDSNGHCSLGNAKKDRIDPKPVINLLLIILPSVAISFLIILRCLLKIHSRYPRADHTRTEATNTVTQQEPTSQPEPSPSEPAHLEIQISE
tara:strand:+ start:13086 stop:13934 length:849 start_codon:yes stop_codon:yes gene_type:complete